MSAVFRTGYPNASSYGVSTNADNVRANLQNLREMIAQFSGAPGFDIPVSGGMTYVSGQLTGVLYQESTAAAAADTPTRSAAQRIFIRQTLSYTSGNLTKVRYEISYDAGSTYIDWVDLAGEAFLNLTYNTNGLESAIWGAS
jgi:hypothetical protein